MKQHKPLQNKPVCDRHTYLSVQVSVKTEQSSSGLCVPLPSSDVKGFNFPDKMQGGRPASREQIDNLYEPLL